MCVCCAEERRQNEAKIHSLNDQLAAGDVQLAQIEKVGVTLLLLYVLDLRTLACTGLDRAPVW